MRPPDPVDVSLSGLVERQPGLARRRAARLLLTLTLLLAVSLAVRWWVYVELGVARAHPLYDEGGYYEQALGFARL